MTEPEVWVRSASGTIPAPTAAAEPEEEPATEEPSDEPTLESREGTELPEGEDAGRRDPTRWFIYSGLIVVGLLVLVRSLRPH